MTILRAPDAGRVRVFAATLVGCALLIATHGVGHAVANLGASPTMVDFGSHDQEVASSATDVTITNSGMDPAISITYDIVGTNPGDFSITNSPLTTLDTTPPDDDTTVSVVFTPQAPGTRNAILRVSYTWTGNMSPTPTELDVPLTGVGLGPNIVLDSASHTFTPAQAVNTSSTAFPVVITNDGNEVLNVTGASKGMANDCDHFTINNPSGMVMTGGVDSLTLNITFSPLAVGSFTCNITIASDDPDSPSTVYQVNGTSTGSQLVVSATVLAFNTQLVNSSSGVMSFTIQNIGTTSVSVSSVAIPMADNEEDYIISNFTSGTIAASSSVTVNVVFHPIAPGAQDATILISSDADVNPNPTKDCTGTGIKPDIITTPAHNGTLPFGTVAPGASSSLQVTVANANFSYTSTLTVDTVVITGTDASQFSHNASDPYTILKNGSVNFNVTFSPTGLGSRSAVLEIHSDDQETDPVIINLTGTSSGPDITVTTPTGPPPWEIDFGSVVVADTSGGQPIAVKNDGDLSLTINSVTIVGTNASDFAITNGTVSSHTVAAGGTSSWTVTCTPGATGSRTATFRIASNDPDEDPTDVDLTCTGIQSDLRVIPTPVTFPDTRVCETSSNVTVTLENQGTASVTINSTSVTGPFNKVTDPVSNTLGAGQSTTMQLSFEPLSMGNLTGSLVVASTDPSSPLTVNLSGIGRLAEASVNPTTVAYGNVRADEPPVPRVVTVTNTGDANWQITGISISDTTNFALTTGTIPRTVTAGGGNTTFTVTAQPATLGTHNATITVMTDIPGNGASCAVMPITIPVTSNAVEPGPQITPTTIDFGNVPVDDGEVTQQVTIMNNGTAGLVVENLGISGPNLNVFSVTTPLPTPFTIAVGASTVVTVGYDPTVEALGAASDTAQLDIVVDARTTNHTVLLSGSGTDRHISVSPTGVIDFGTVFRYPETPATRVVTVSNPGLAALNVSMVMEEDMSDVFTVSDTSAFQVAASGSHDLTLTFDPKASGTFNGFITLVNNDNGDPMHRFGVTGMGVTPNVGTSPNVPIDLGRTGVNVPLEVDIDVVNQETQAFTVRELLAVSKSGAPAESADYFSISGLPANTPIEASSSLPFKVTFTADKPGRFTVEVQVFVNNDPNSVSVIEVTGEAVDVQVRGGGCSAADSGGDRGGLILALLMALGLLCVPRLRRALAGRKGPYLALLIACSFLVGGEAGAEPTRNLDLSIFRPVPATEANMLSVENTRVGVPGAWALGIFLNHAVNPLKVESPQVDGMTDRPITGRTAAELAFSYAFADKYEAGALLSLIQQSGEAPLFSGLQPAEGNSLGDVALHGKARWFASGSMSFATSATVTLPTASDDQFAGVNGPSLAGRGILGIDGRRIDFAGNVGVRVRGTGSLGDLQQGNEVTYGLGFSYQMKPRLSAIGELYGAYGMGGGDPAGVSPLETTVGIRYRLSRQLGLASGLGRGVMPGIGASDFRAFVLVYFAPKARAWGPPIGLLPPGEIDPGDDDADGIINSSDRCPKEPEDKDGFQDEDGCPDPDNDDDGIPDAKDKCPKEAEDKDGFKDADGCPDPDNDGDGIPDAKDKCPNEAEDKDGYQDDDGCDDPDNDGDGIPDVIDQCATQPETINGKQDDDGCPDSGDSLVMVMPDRIEVFSPVKFVGKTARIAKASHNVLGQVAATLRANRDFVRIRIGVHVHPRGRNDMALTKTRAQAVRKWLVQWGIEPERLEIRGYGSTRLLVPKRKRGARKVNDRVEFVILEKRVKGARKKKR